jgi:hypothetical protein
MHSQQAKQVRESMHREEYLEALEDIVLLDLPLLPLHLYLLLLLVVSYQLSWTVTRESMYVEDSDLLL